MPGGYFEYNFVSGEIPYPDDDQSYVHGSYCASNDLRHNVKGEVMFVDGYTAANVMLKNEAICVMPRFMMEELGLGLGDTVELNEYMYLYTLMTYNEGKPMEWYLEMYHRHGAKAKIVGCIEGGDNTVYIPLAGKGFFKTLFSPVYLSLAEFSLADYHKAVELRAYAKTLLEPDERHQPRFSMDTSEADRVYNTSQMIETLYPIAFAAAVLTGAMIMGLLILQRAREAATLRVLGTTKKRARSMMTIEQILLCLLGLLIALAVLIALNGAGLIKTAEAIGVYLAVHLAASLIGCAVAAVSVTKHKALELLQVKE